MKEEAIFFLDMREKDPKFQKTNCFSIIIVDLNGEYTSTLYIFDLNWPDMSLHYKRYYFFYMH